MQASALFRYLFVFPVVMGGYDEAVNPKWADDLRDALDKAVQEGRVTQTRVAEVAGVTQPAVSQFLSGITKGKNREVEVPIFLATCQLLNLNPYEVFGIGPTHEAAVLPSSDDPTQKMANAFGHALVRALHETQPGRQAASAPPRSARRRKRHRKNR